MSDVVALYRRAMDGFGDLVRSVRGAQWDAPTPCTGWTVRDVANHVLAENRWVPPMMEGRTVAEVGDAFDGDLVGDDPGRAWDEAAEAALAAMAEPGALERTVHLSFGDYSGRFYLGQLLSDHVIHRWDLARALGADEQLDHDLVRFAYAELVPQFEAWRRAGAFGPKVEVPEGADLQTKLLAESGRAV